MTNLEKVCPVVSRTTDQGLEVLAFSHPTAGKQFVKGTIENGETPRAAAERELREESGVGVHSSPLMFVGKHKIGEEGASWHFFAYQASGLPDVWVHSTEDDHGHTFSFFWHSVDRPLGPDWHPMFHQAFEFFASRLLSR